MALAAAVAALLALPPQDTDAERLRRLEEEVRRQKEEIEKLKSARPSETDGGLRGSLTDGLRFRTPEGTVELHIGGRFLEHLRVLPHQPEDSPRLAPDTFLLRSARVRVDGLFFSQYAFQVDTEFASSGNAAGATLQNAYVEWRKLETFRLQAGQFKVPIGQERLRSQLFSDFVENAPLTRFVPGYDIGLLACGRLASGALDYQAALVHGRSHLDNAGRMRRDDNDEKELAARVAVSPWAPNKDAFFLKGLRIALAGTWTEVEEVPITGPEVSHFDLSTYELGILFFDPDAAGPVSLDGRRTRLGAELSWAAGPACLRAEMLLRRDEWAGPGGREEVPVRGGSVSLSWVLTGEERDPDSRIAPRQPLGEDGGWGALELAARLARAEIGDDVENVGIILAGNALEVTSTSFGLNWWPARNVRISLNIVRERFGEPLDLGNGRTEDTFTGLLGRFQIDF